MATTIRAVFDGEVFRLEDAGGLRPGVTYVITVEEAPAEGEEGAESEEVYPLTRLREMATDLGIDDFASRHDWYAHGRLPDDDPR
jgi:hypothetical protein